MLHRFDRRRRVAGLPRAASGECRLPALRHRRHERAPQRVADQSAARRHSGRPRPGTTRLRALQGRHRTHGARHGVFPGRGGRKRQAGARSAEPPLAAKHAGADLAPGPPNRRADRLHSPLASPPRPRPHSERDGAVPTVVFGSRPRRSAVRRSRLRGRCGGARTCSLRRHTDLQRGTERRGTDSTALPGARPCPRSRLRAHRRR